MEKDSQSPATINATTDLAARYARALFALASEEAHPRGGGQAPHHRTKHNSPQQSPPVTSTSVEIVATSLDKISTALTKIAGLKTALASSVLSRRQAKTLTTALANALALDDLTTKFLGVLCANRRLVALTSIIAAFKSLHTTARGQVRAMVTSAHPLDDTQLATIAERLSLRCGRQTLLTPRHDPTLLGGLVIDIGSERIDSSIRTRLHNITHAMKG